LKGNYTINEFITTVVAPKATVYTNNLPFESLQTEWIKFDKALIVERRGLDRHFEEAGLAVMSHRITRWAMDQDPLVFERFKQLVVSATSDITRPPQQVKNKPQVLYITRHRDWSPFAH
jgi:hypothetical protein